MTILLLLTSVVAAARGLWSPCGLSMLSSLNPVAERSRGHRFGLTALWYLAGSVLGGAAVGGLGALGADLVGLAGWPTAVPATLALGGAVVALASDLRLGGWSLPDHPRQVDERWLTTYRRWIYAGGYGVQIGTGFATYVMTAGVYLLAWLAVTGGRPAPALAAGVLFGLVRGATIVLAGLARTPARLQVLMARVDAAAGASSGLAAATCAAVAIGAAGTLGGPVAASGAAIALAVGVAGTRFASSRRRANDAGSVPSTAARGPRSLGRALT